MIPRRMGSGMSYLAQHWVWAGPLLAVGLVAAWLFWHRQALRPRRRAVLLSCLLIVSAVGLGWFYHGGFSQKSVHAASALFLGAFSAWCCLRVVDRAFDASAGGLLFDLIFCDGSFAEKWSTPSKLPDLTLLEHWRTSGQSKRALRVAMHNLTDRTPLPFWMFAAETSAVWLDDCRQAERIVRRLCRSKSLSHDQKTFAVNSLKSWAADRGYEVKAAKLLRPSSHGKKRASRIIQWLRKLGPGVKTSASKPLPEPSPSAASMRALAASEVHKAFQALLDMGYLGKAVAGLEEYLAANPEDFDCAMLLFEAWIEKFDNPHKAEEVVRQVLKNPACCPEQKELISARLRTWKRQRLSGAPTATEIILRMVDDEPGRA